MVHSADYKNLGYDISTHTDTLTIQWLNVVSDID